MIVSNSSYVIMYRYILGITVGNSKYFEPLSVTFFNFKTSYWVRGWLENNLCKPKKLKWDILNEKINKIKKLINFCTWITTENFLYWNLKTVKCSKRLYTGAQGNLNYTVS